MENSRVSVGERTPRSMSSSETAGANKDTMPRANGVTAVPVSAPSKPLPPPAWSRSICGGFLTVFLFFILLGAALLVCALPPIYIESDTGRKIYVAVMVPMTAVLGTVMCCYTFVVPYIRSNRFLIKSAGELDRHKEFLISSRAQMKQMALLSATDDPISPLQTNTIGGDDLDAQSQYYHRSPAAQQHADSLDIKREMSWIHRQLERLLTERTLRSGNPTMSVQQRSLQVFLFSFLALQQEIMSLLQENITQLKAAQRTSSTLVRTITTSRTPARTPAHNTPRDVPLSSAFPPHAPASPALKPVHLAPNGDGDDKARASPIAASSYPRSLPCDVTDVSGVDIPVDDEDLPSIGQDVDAPAPTPSKPVPPGSTTPKMARFDPLLSDPISQANAAPTASQSPDTPPAKRAVPTASPDHNEASLATTARMPSAEPSGTHERVATGVHRDGASTGSAAPTPLAPKPVPRGITAASLTLQRGSRFPSDGPFVFLQIVSKSRSGFMKRETTFLVEASVSPDGAAVGDTHTFAPNSKNGLPFHSYCLVGGQRRTLSIIERRQVGFVTCDIEKVSLDDTASPVTSDRDSAIDSPTEKSPNVLEGAGSSALLQSSSKRFSKCTCPSFTSEESFIVSWAPLPDVPMRLTFLTVDFEDTSTDPPQPPRRVALPVLECLIQDVLCVVTRFTTETRGSNMVSVTLEGLSLEDAASRGMSSNSSMTGASPTKARDQNALAPASTLVLDETNGAALCVGAIFTQTITLPPPGSDKL